MYRQIAHEDFWRAYRRSFWRRFASWITGKDNQLLPYSEVRQSLPFSGQRDLGVQAILVDKIVGSVGRYRDFDRAFLPTRRINSQRWINVQQARYADVELPAIDVYKLGDVYFVRDGNHRVSVARQRNQPFIDAYVTEIDIPISLSPNDNLEAIQQKRTYAEFMQQTGLNKLRPDANLELSMANEYGRLLDHINTHRYYLGLEQQRDISDEEAVLSWYDNVYQPLIELIQENNLQAQFPDRTLTDLYWWVSEYQWLRKESTIETDKVEEEAENLLPLYNIREVRQVIRKLRQADWVDRVILQQEKSRFFEMTGLDKLHPEAKIHLTLPGKYDKMLEQISEHRWYLGEHLGQDVPYETAVDSWFHHVYEPIIELIREAGYLERFPQRTEADLYLWLLDHRQDMIGALDDLTSLPDELPNYHPKT